MVLPLTAAAVWSISFCSSGVIVAISTAVVGRFKASSGLPFIVANMVGSVA